MCNYEKYAMRREREKKEKRNEELNAMLFDGLRQNSREQSLNNLFCSLTFVVGTANVVYAKQNQAMEAAF